MIPLFADWSFKSFVNLFGLAAPNIDGIVFLFCIFCFVYWCVHPASGAVENLFKKF